mmetsp:Transcript_22390/g.35983  ORF Transcript_22390/g.35983 Transcript_22390/m.35983 type:complete len:149 (-) Transcript_22390:102-548(-)
MYATEEGIEFLAAVDENAKPPSAIPPSVRLVSSCVLRLPRLPRYLLYPNAADPPSSDPAAIPIIPSIQIRLRALSNTCLSSSESLADDSYYKIVRISNVIIVLGRGEQTAAPSNIRASTVASVLTECTIVRTHQVRKDVNLLITFDSS